MRQVTERFRETGFFSPLDLHFGRFLYEMDPDKGESVFLAGALAACFQRKGHVCVDLSDYAGSPLPRRDETDSEVLCPDMEDWRKALEKSGVVGAPGEYTPLVLDGKNRLYLYRYWDYQDRLARFIRKSIRPEVVPHDVDAKRLGAGLERLFPIKKKTLPTGRRSRPLPL